MLLLAAKPSLVERCVAGDDEAWRELHRRHYPAVASFLRHMGVPPVDLEDACQEVFVQVFRYLARFEHRADLKTWLYKLCLSHAARRRRRAKVAGALRWLLNAQPARGANLVGEWSEADAIRRVQSALDRMKPIHREVFVLYELEGLAGEGIAGLLGIPHSTVRRRLHDARQRFEDLIKNGEHP